MPTTQPFFVWLNTTWMHFRVHPPKADPGSGRALAVFYHDAMVEHDKHVGQMLDLLDELGIADDTIVMYSTDNGPHMNTWPDGAMTPFRNEKNSNWEGAFRIPGAGTLARQDQGWHGLQRDHQPHRLAAHPAGGSR